MILSMFIAIYIEFFSLHRIDLKLTTLHKYWVFRLRRPVDKGGFRAFCHPAQFEASFFGTKSRIF